MGKGSSQQTSSSGTVTRQPTAEETQLNKMDVALREATQPGLIEMQKSGYALGNQLLQGKDLPGWMQGMANGIDPNVTRSIVGQSMNDVNAGMAGRGLLDSGTAAAVGARASGDIRRAAEEFNIGNKLNMLNLALTGQAQIQQPTLGFSSGLGQRLSNLAGTTQQGTVTRYSAQGGGLTW